MSRPTPAFRGPALLLIAAAGCSFAGPEEPVFVPGRSYLGQNGYIEYLAGNAPLILSAGHGGSLVPAELPDRTAERCGGTVVVVTDLNTAELAVRVRAAFLARYGSWPHVIINHLSRRKLDPNREEGEAACGNPAAETAFQEWHRFIAIAREAATTQTGGGWYVDLHGHGHSEQRLELGYLLDGATLGQSDAALDADPRFERESSIWSFSREYPGSFSALLRGPASLGGRYEAEGYRAVPGPSEPDPGGMPYFEGGVNTRRHTCGTRAIAPGGKVCGVQLEANFTGVRDTPENRQRFAEATVKVMADFLPRP